MSDRMALDVLWPDDGPRPGPMPSINGGHLQILDARSGEIVTLAEATLDQLGLTIEWLNGVGRRILELRSGYEDEIRRRLDLDRLWTQHSGGVHVEAPSDMPEDVWDKVGLRAALAQLVAAELISEAAAASCWLTPKPPDPGVSKRGAEKLLKHPSAEVRDAIAACRRQVSKTSRPVKVTIKEEAHRG